jgi:hypothetical protein
VELPITASGVRLLRRGNFIVKTGGDKLWQCTKCGRRFANRNQSHFCSHVTLESHFEGKPSETRSLYEAFLAVVQSHGPVVVLPEKTRISISGTISGDSSLTPAGPAGVFVQSFKGNGDDTIMGAFTSISQSLIDFSKPPAIVISNGAFFETFSGGALFGTSSGSGTANGNGTASVTIDFIFTGGTGLFAGATGEATVTGTITSTSSTTESITGSYVGTLSVVPEPTTLALFVPAIAVGAVTAVCRRRREARDHRSD